MAARMTEMQPRLIERLRAELAEVIAASVAYPPFFDFRANRLVTRPLDRARLEDIQRFLSSANFAPLERADVTAPETRRFIERLIVRYVEVNEALRGRYAAIYAPRLRAQAARLATETQRRAVGYLNGAAPDFGARRQTVSWSNSSRRSQGRSAEERERATRVLESALLQRGAAPASAPLPTPVTPARPDAPDPWRGLPEDVTTPVPSTAYPGVDWNATPYEAFGAGSGGGFDQSSNGRPAAHGVSGRLSEQPTGPMPIAPAQSQPPVASQAPRAGGPPMRDLPPDLYQLYGDYLNDMEPEAVAPPPPPEPPRPRQAPQPPPASANYAPAPTSEDARNDQLIFWQLRYQLEAYVRRAARSYGASHNGADPATVLDALRRTGFVDEADLRIAESVFALTDRVTARGHATEPEYRQALMLYLLYHRSHLNM